MTPNVIVTEEHREAAEKLAAQLDGIMRDGGWQSHFVGAIALVLAQREAAGYARAIRDASQKASQHRPLCTILCHSCQIAARIEALAAKPSGGEP